MMRKTIIYITASTLLLGLMISAWFAVNNLQSVEPALYSLMITIIVTSVLAVRLFAKDILKEKINLITKLKYFKLISIIVIGIFATSVRLFFYFNFSYLPVSDPVTFYDAARKIADGQGLIGDSYVAFYPYLAAYDNILGYTMKIITDPWLATISLNTMFDIGAATIAYFLVKNLTKQGSMLPIVIFGVWLFNPFNILFSVLSLPIVIVNFFIITTIFITFLLNKSLSENKKLSFISSSLALGLTIGYGNYFRPVFSIAIIALVLLFIYIVCTNNKSFKLLFLLISSFTIISLTFITIQKINISSVAAQTGMDATSTYGWSVYVGSNSNSNGTWNQLDPHNKNVICKNTSNNEACSVELQKAGIERYQQMGVSGTLDLFVRKLHTFSSNQSDVYNANDSISGYSNSRTKKIMNLYTNIFVITLSTLSVIFFYLSTKRFLLRNRVAPTVLFSTILMAGFFLSSMLVETSPRYAQIMYPLISVFAVLSIGLINTRLDK